MMINEQLAKVYDTVLCIPGMNDQVKLDLKISRRQVLLLTQILGRGLKEETDQPTGIFSFESHEALTDLSKISDDFLEKAGLTELSKKLINF